MNVTRELWVGDGSELRCEIEGEWWDAKRLAQALANTEGDDVSIVMKGTITTLERVKPDENEYPQLTLAERARITKTSDLLELIRDAEQKAVDADIDRQILTDELKRRAS